MQQSWLILQCAPPLRQTQLTLSVADHARLCASSIRRKGGAHCSKHCIVYHENTADKQVFDPPSTLFRNCFHFAVDVKAIIQQRSRLSTTNKFWPVWVY